MTVFNYEAFKSLMEICAANVNALTDEDFVGLTCTLVSFQQEILQQPALARNCQLCMFALAETITSESSEAKWRLFAAVMASLRVHDLGAPPTPLPNVVSAVNVSRSMLILLPLVEVDKGTIIVRFLGEVLLKLDRGTSNLGPVEASVRPKLASIRNLVADRGSVDMLALWLGVNLTEGE